MKHLPLHSDPGVVIRSTLHDHGLAILSWFRQDLRIIGIVSVLSKGYIGYIGYVGYIGYIGYI